MFAGTAGAGGRPHDPAKRRVSYELEASRHSWPRSEGVEVAVPADPAAELLESAGNPQRRVAACIRKIAQHITSGQHGRNFYSLSYECFLVIRQLYCFVVRLAVVLSSVFMCQ